jgi:hypothetical protein
MASNDRIAVMEKLGVLNARQIAGLSIAALSPVEALVFGVTFESDDADTRQDRLRHAMLKVLHELNDAELVNLFRGVSDIEPMLDSSALLSSAVEWFENMQGKSFVRALRVDITPLAGIECDELGIRHRGDITGLSPEELDQILREYGQITDGTDAAKRTRLLAFYEDLVLHRFSHKKIQLCLQSIGVRPRLKRDHPSGLRQKLVQWLRYPNAIINGANPVMKKPRVAENWTYEEDSVLLRAMDKATGQFSKISSIAGVPCADSLAIDDIVYAFDGVTPLWSAGADDSMRRTTPEFWDFAVNICVREFGLKQSAFGVKQRYNMLLVKRACFDAFSNRKGAHRMTKAEGDVLHAAP